MGGNNFWILGIPFGLGSRTANIIGTDSRLVIGWKQLFGFKSDPVEELGKTKKSAIFGTLFGIGGAVDVIAHDKVLLNYFGQNITVERKSNPEFVFKSKYEKARFAERLLRQSLLRYGVLVLVSSVMAARILYLTHRDDNLLAITLIRTIVPLVESRWLLLVLYLEKGCVVLDKTEKEAAASMVSLLLSKNNIETLNKSILGVTPWMLNQGDLASRVFGSLKNSLIRLGQGVAMEAENMQTVIEDHMDLLVPGE